MSQSMQKMQSTLLTQFQALQPSTNMDTYQMETVHMIEDTPSPEIGTTKTASFPSHSSPVQPIMKAAMTKPRHDPTYAAKNEPQQLSHQQTNLMQPTRNDGFYLSQETSAPSSQGGMTQ